ncbi:peptidyl-prolyl cis-trans isomerase [Aureibaculum sp. 2210JD6-5]|uniref:peptidyl-prolyl cis-trans isomerase n=1 Tax=Aureibaculum sp. 2210JD6-5 TaxID=3103957 RepID=UPI002AAE43E9|nr:peptidyl-prolyl cis-trans isomerase [Aureibaculum sp. 2210JD6-5]MDY7395155.1 peptidyl-prolyl cis-trans isomerase [Aureibaculum sp. 2210JD6-5]
MRTQFTYIFLILVIFSCHQKEDEGKPVAKVYDTFLYEKDIKEILPENISKEDSLIFIKNYINKWAKQQLLVQKAKINLQEEKEQINTLVNQYHQDLLINKYKEAVVKQDLDTLVTTADIEKFYEENKEIFKLNEALVKFRYIYFDKEINNVKEFVSLFRENDYTSDKEIMKQELQLKSHNLNDSIWIKYDDVLKNAPFLKSENKNDFLQKSKFIHKEDSTGVYLVKIKDVLLRNDTAPMSYALPTIKQMILHKRKLQLLKKIEETLTEDAIKNKEFQIY